MLLKNNLKDFPKSRGKFGKKPREDTYPAAQQMQHT